jgi:hypothetical protein
MGQEGVGGEGEGEGRFSGALKKELIDSGRKSHKLISEKII